MSTEEKDAALSKHRFLVQTKIISEELYRRILEIPQTDRGEEVCLTHLAPPHSL
jgi:hypothetical protein